MEAELSGGGGSGDEEEADYEDEDEDEVGDLSNIGDFQPTQAQGYNQHAAYVQSLMYVVSCPAPMAMAVGEVC